MGLQGSGSWDGSGRLTAWPFHPWAEPFILARNTLVVSSLAACPCQRRGVCLLIPPTSIGCNHPNAEICYRACSHSVLLEYGCKVRAILVAGFIFQKIQHYRG